MNKLLLILLSTIAFTSCEVAPVYLSQETADREIVVNCLFKPDAIFIASLSETRFREAFTFDTIFAISDADVRLYEDGVLIGRFVENDTLDFGIGRYRYERGVYTLDYYPVPGKTYRIEATKQGYDSVWAESRIPPVRGNIETRQVSKINMFEPDDSHLYHHFDMSVLLKDLPGADFYHLEIYHELWLIDFLTRDTLDSDFGEVWLKTVDQEFIIQISGPSGRDELIFNDLLFDGTGLQIDFRELGRGHASYVMSKDEDLSNLDDDYYVKYYAYLMNLSFEYYEYFRTGKQQLKTIEDPFAEPVRVYSNIHNGKGVFAGYNKQIFPIPAGFLYYEGDWN